MQLAKISLFDDIYKFEIGILPALIPAYCLLQRLFI